ncbi:hypothetical protein HHK36_006162 [Tetracentron sinense]|uniref:IST1-like protein n=1 Tax=Tetracentron sinense TaxID=13715 RepID=A0A834ZIC0_TETSI|nr:hypothetical protein HHK36_006162 [Tetracentron sinense]
MLDGLLGRGFSSKCKSSIKIIRTRIDTIRKRKNATQNILKKDIAELLVKGHHDTAYRRAEELLVELKLSSCYDFIEQYCGCILKQLSVMQKQRECPEECREAVPSLMFAAARIADLHELRDLRDIFSERYGNSLESFLNPEFVEKLASKPPTMEKKLQLMQAITYEFSIEWDFKAFEQKMYNPPASAQDQPKKQGSFHETKNDGYKACNGKDGAVPKRENQDVSSRGRRELTDAGHKSSIGREGTVSKRDYQDLSSRGRRDVTDVGQKSPNGREDIGTKRENLDISSRGRREITDDGYKSHIGRDDAVPKRDNRDISSRGRREINDVGYKPRNSREDAVWKRDGQDISSHGRHEATDDGYTPCRSIEDAILKRDNQDVSSRGRQEFIGDGHKQCNRADTVQKNGNLDGSSRGRREHIDDRYKLRNGREDAEILSNERLDFVPSYTTRQQDRTYSKDIPVVRNSHNGQHNHSHSIRKVSEEEANDKKAYTNAVPPPYVKPKGGKYGTNLEARHAGSNFNEAPMDHPTYNRNIANNMSERTQTEVDRDNYVRQVVGPGTAGMKGHGEEKEYNHNDDSVCDAKPKPRSVRSRHLKPPPGDEIGNFDHEAGVVKRNPNGRRREDVRRGLQILSDYDHDRKDDEEKMMDKLLMHYSKKESAYEPGKARTKLKAPQHHVPTDAGESPSYKSRDGTHLNSELGPPTRAVSLPPQPITPMEAAKGPTRAASFQPDMNPAGHVHPKLPNYDDVAAQFAALRGAKR